MQGSELNLAQPNNPFGLGFTFSDVLDPLPLLDGPSGIESNLSWDAVVSGVESDLLGRRQGCPTGALQQQEQQHRSRTFHS